MKVFTNDTLDNTETNTANVEDEISTDNAAEMMPGYNEIDGVPFFEWIKISDNSMVNVEDSFFRKFKTAHNHLCYN